MRVIHVLLVTVALVCTVSTTSAFAWSCLAIARSNGAEGWSYNYGYRDGAIIRALEECGIRGRFCHIVRCNRWG